jgi:hypothetical protein
MSWMIKKVGKRKGVFAEIKNDANLPSEIKAACLSVLGDEPDAPSGVRVEGYGHTYQGKGSSFSSIGKLEVEPIQLTE